MNWPLMYLCPAVAWTVIETQLSIDRIENDERHWLNRTMKRIRAWSRNRSMPISVGGRILACFFLAIFAWIPVLLVSFIWPVTVSIYVFCNLRKED
ncbi:hypothetical protein MF451_003764 [Salmonella enterica subsp. enterica serovar Saintpaul]|nr:hypothetical protein [Salmonella enterica subsp. enterica serovar Saintpaul]